MTVRGPTAAASAPLPPGSCMANEPLGALGKRRDVFAAVGHLGGPGGPLPVEIGSADRAPIELVATALHI